MCRTAQVGSKVCGREKALTQAGDWPSGNNQCSSGPFNLGKWSGQGLRARGSKEAQARSTDLGCSRGRDDLCKAGARVGVVTRGSVLEDRALSSAWAQGWTCQENLVTMGLRRGKR